MELNRTMKPKDCALCGGPIPLPRWSSILYCSEECASIKRRERTSKRRARPELRKIAAERSKEWSIRNPGRKESWKEKDGKRRLERKTLVFNHYGNFCNCCGEEYFPFLSIDHINGDGAKHGLGGHELYSWLLTHDFPEGFQILCMNCNYAKKLDPKCQCPYSGLRGGCL